MKTKYMLSIVSICVLLSACSDNMLNEQQNGLNPDEPIMLSASISESFTSRADEENPAEGKRKYIFSYIDKTTSNNSYSSKELEFDKQGKCIPDDLTWGDVKTNVSNSVFVLDNLTVVRNNNQITLGENYTAQASEGDGKGNDILWDAVPVNEQNPLDGTHFELKHCMSKLTFVISSDNDEIKNLLQYGEIIVQLWNVVTTPTTFNFITGMVSNNNKKINEEYALNLLVNTTPVEEDGFITVNTDSWIFPPQTFAVTGDSNERPHLKIILTSKDETNQKQLTFTGPLLESMLYEGQYLPLEFKSEFHLIVNVKLSSKDENHIQFRPVLVKRWKDYTPKDIVANQVGVYTKDELVELVGAYNDNPSENNLKLWKYGVLNTNSEDNTPTWTFYLWKNITGYEVINSSLGLQDNNEVGFVFESNGHTVNGLQVNEVGNLYNAPQITE